METTDNAFKTALKVEIMLQINQKLLERGIISKETYEAAISKIVSKHPEDLNLPGVSV